MPDFYSIWAILGEQGPEKYWCTEMGLPEARKRADALMEKHDWFAVGVRPQNEQLTRWSYLNSRKCGPSNGKLRKKLPKFAKVPLPMEGNPLWTEKT